MDQKQKFVKAHGEARYMRFMYYTLHVFNSTGEYLTENELIKLLDMPRSTLQYWIKVLKIEEERAEFEEKLQEALRRFRYPQ